MKLIQQDGEKRINYLARVLHELMNNTIAGEQQIHFDGTVCDGLCLANDFLAELSLDSDDFPKAAWAANK